MLDTIVVSPGTPEAGAESLNPEFRVMESEDTYGKVAVEPAEKAWDLN